MRKKDIEKKLERVEKNITYYKKIYPRSDKLKALYKDRRILKSKLKVV